LLILDEPMESMDPAVKEDALRELVDLTASEGTTIFFSSHQISEVEQIADHICIIDHGFSKVAGAIDDMKTRYHRIQITFPDDPPSSVRWVDGVEQVRQEGRVLSIVASDNLDAILAQGRSLPGAMTETFPMSLKEIFLGHVRNH
jgi:ABC-2 type transport system ATP-binding protein